MSSSNSSEVDEGELHGESKKPLCEEIIMADKRKLRTSKYDPIIDDFLASSRQRKQIEPTYPKPLNYAEASNLSSNLRRRIQSRNLEYVVRAYARYNKVYLEKVTVREIDLDYLEKEGVKLY